MGSDGIPMYLESYLNFISDVALYWSPADLQARYEACLSSSSDAGSTHYEGVVMAGSPARVVDEAASEHEHPSSKNNEGMCDGRYFDATTPASLERSTVQRVVSGDAPSFDAHVLGTISTRARLYFEGFNSFDCLSLPNLICTLRDAAAACQAPKPDEPESVPAGLDALADLLYSHGFGPRALTSY